nr:MAG TPA: hypothetical protein [Caudoviricetes sp.]
MKIALRAIFLLDLCCDCLWGASAPQTKDTIKR